MQINYLNRFKIPDDKIKKLADKKYGCDTSKYIERWKFMKECAVKGLKSYDKDFKKFILGFKISTVSDDRTCPDCNKLEGKGISFESLKRGYGPPYHIDCRCGIDPIIDKSEMPKTWVSPKDFETMDYLRIADLECQED